MIKNNKGEIIGNNIIQKEVIYFMAKKDELEKAGKFAEEMRQKLYGEFAGKN